mmetsp:Transcript_1657/g.2688  ORF Transcript_1657/g.2688 Transcript_1657/m.2688 type:complete len:90 (-) Transcript_1657:6-275(-)
MLLFWCATEEESAEARNRMDTVGRRISVTRADLFSVLNSNSKEKGSYFLRREKCIVDVMMITATFCFSRCAVPFSLAFAENFQKLVVSG